MYVIAGDGENSPLFGDHKAGLITPRDLKCHLLATPNTIWCTEPTARVAAIFSVPFAKIISIKQRHIEPQKPTRMPCASDGLKKPDNALAKIYSLKGQFNVGSPTNFRLFRRVI
jgi:hypothetical protein